MTGRVRRLTEVAPDRTGKKVVRVGQAEQAEQAEFKVLKDREGKYYWNLQAASNRIMAWSGQSYESKYGCVQDVNWLRANAYLIMVYDCTGESAQQSPR